jgi:tetraacyldisaccharide 4'-kinase
MSRSVPRRREPVIERVWYGGAVSARVARAALVPFERLYAGAVAIRSQLYDSGRAKVYPAAVPAVSIGNLSVGGTGKTPMAAWFAAALRARGAHPAIVLRGYGGDEADVHRILNPDVPVIVDADRVLGVRHAADAGADLAVLDDAFQHRRLARVADVVLVSADRWTANHRLLPAGPWREPMEAIRRATLVIVTRKAADDEQVNALCGLVAALAPAVPVCSIRLAADALVRVGDGERMEIGALQGRAVHLIAAIGDPGALVRQLEEAGATVTADLFRDHHALTGPEIATIATGIGPKILAVCTLKDAVKMGDRWPREGPALWYVSQRVIVERGVGAIEGVLDGLLRARHQNGPTAG